MIKRRGASRVRELLSTFPAVALTGSRQVGKTTLARSIAAAPSQKSLYLDLERPSDELKLQEAELFLERHSDKLVIIDEIQRRPDLFPLLRALIDQDRRPGRFLLLGSAAPSLILSSAESLAGRIGFHELLPFDISEVPPNKADWRLWIRGGFPESFLAGTDKASLDWREAFIRTHLERDIPSFGLKIPATTLRRFWTMLAHVHGQLWNGSRIASAFGLSQPTIRHYLDILQDTLMVRQLPAFSTNLGKRLVKAPKVYLRDTGLLHAFLGVSTMDDLLGNPVLGASWEGWIIEQIHALLPSPFVASFYRTSAGAEIDLVIEIPGRKRRLAFAMKHSLAPAPSKGFFIALKDLSPVEAFVVYPGKDEYPLGKNITVVGVEQLPRIIESLPLP